MATAPDNVLKHEQLSLLTSMKDDGAELVKAYEDICVQHHCQVWVTLDELITLGHSDVVDHLVKGMLDAHPDDPMGWDFAMKYFFNLEGFAKGIPIFEALLEQCPEHFSTYGQLIHNAYRFLAFAYKYTENHERVGQVLKRGYEHCSRPIDYQPTAMHQLPEDVQVAVLTELCDDEQAPLPERQADIFTASQAPLSIATQHAQEIGTDCAVLSGVLSHAAAGSEYCFQYGSSLEALDQQTDFRPIPPGLFSEVRDTTLSTFSSWLCYGTTHAFSTKPCAITSKSPFALDRNHVDGVGQVTLLYGWLPSCLKPGDEPSPLRMHSIDLRGGKVSFQIRHKNMDAKGGEFVFGVASGVAGPKQQVDQKGKDWRATAWMMTGKPLPCTDTTDGEWGELSFNLEADPELWSYASNNTNEQSDSARYTYAPLAEVMERHNGNLIMYQMFADEREIPEGEITLREGRVVYRDWSMLRNGNGAELLTFPGEDRNGALKLTNGQYRNPADGWYRTKEDATSPCKFVWQLPEGAQPDGVVLVQHPQYPVLFAQVYLREGGPDGRIVYAGMPSLPETGIDQPKRFFIETPKDLSATHLEVNLMQGQNPEGIGLMGVELFGKFAPQHPTHGPVTVCEDIDGLKPGSDLYYRLVYRDEGGITQGETRTLKMPIDATPMVHGIKPMEGDPRAWLIQANPMGADTVLEVRLDGEVIDELPLGRGIYRRHMVVRVTEDQYAPGKVLEVVAKNEHGSSAAMSLIIT